METILLLMEVDSSEEDIREYLGCVDYPHFLAFEEPVHHEGAIDPSDPTCYPPRGSNDPDFVQATEHFPFEDEMKKYSVVEVEWDPSSENIKSQTYNDPDEDGMRCITFSYVGPLNIKSRQQLTKDLINSYPIDNDFYYPGKWHYFPGTPENCLGKQSN